MSRERAKPVRIIPPLTDQELDSRRGGVTGPPNGAFLHDGAPVTDATFRRVEEALRWHEARAKRKARAS